MNSTDLFSSKKRKMRAAVLNSDYHHEETQQFRESGERASKPNIKSDSKSVSTRSVVSYAGIAQQKLRKAQLQKKKELQSKVKEEEEKYRKWNEWEDTFFASGPTKLAMKHGVTSTAPQQQTTFIKMNDDLKKAKAATHRVEKSPAGPDVQRMLDLQDSKGVWEDSAAFRAALGGYVPDCPDGIVSWRWATALALAFLRSQPDQFPFTIGAYEKAIVWISPPWLLEAATTTLPPFQNYFPLDETAVKEGRWRDAESMLLKNCGYEGFVGYTPPQPMPEMGVACTERETPNSPTKKIDQHRKITDHDRYRSHQKSLRKDFNQLTKPSAGNNLAVLRKVWETPCAIHAERERLNEPSGVQNKVTKWSYKGKNEKEDKVEVRRKQLLAQTAERTLRRQEEARLRALPAPTTPSHHHHHHVASDNHREVVTAEGMVVACCEKYDRYLLEVNKVAAKCAGHWRNARLKSERQHSFDELTEMLGPYQRARLGLIDWRAEPVLGVQSITLALIHAVVRWRKALQDAGKSIKPFVWNNQNILLTIITGLEFLADRYPELVTWYGPEFPWKRNPFSRAASIDERPATPNSAYMKVLVDGELVDKINDRLLGQQLEAQKIVDLWSAKLSKAPKWWPKQGDASHMEKMRDAEKLLLEEESKYRES